MRTQQRKKQHGDKLPSNTCSQRLISQSLHPVLQFQQQLGNHAMQGLLQSGRIQAKVTISQPNNTYEQEAGRAADQIMQLNNISHRSPRKWQTIVRKLAKNITGQDLKRHGFMNLNWKEM